MPRVSFRNLRRWTFATIAIASLVLCLATVGLWVRNRDAMDLLRIGPVQATSTSNRILVLIGAAPRKDEPTFVSYPSSSAGAIELATRLTNPTARGFYWIDTRRSDPPGALLFIAPHWSLALLFAIVPTWWGMAIVRARRRVKPGCCATCGYDLRASIDRCPECGTGVAAGGTL